MAAAKTRVGIIEHPYQPPPLGAKIWRKFIFACSPGTGCA